MSRRGFWFGMLLAIGPWLTEPAVLYGQDTQVVARVSTDTVGVQDQFQLMVTISGANSGEASAPQLTQFKGFQVISGPGVSTQFQWVNGRSNSSRTYSWGLLPQAEGEFTIGPIDVVVGGKTYRTEPLRVKVLPGSQPQPRSSPGVLDPFGDFESSRQPRVSGDELIVVAGLDRDQAYVGQQVTLTYRLLTQVSVTGVQLQESPPLTGFWVEDLEVEQNQAGTRKTVGGREYVEYIVKRQALFPNAPGTLRIASSTFAISAKSVGNLFGLFGPSETLYRKTAELTLDVRPLPSRDRNTPATSAVGSFGLTTALDRSEVAVGSAVTLKVKLEGKGNLKIIPDIPLPPMADLRVYSSKQTQNIRPFEGNVVGGDKTWEYVLVPTAPGIQTIPEMSFSFFNPERERYETVAATELPLKVLPGTNASASSPVAGLQKQTLTRQGADINFLKLAADDLEPPSRLPYRAPWFYGLLGLPLALNACLVLYQRRRLREEENLPLARSRRARRVALQRLRTAAHDQHEPRRFYDEISGALAGYLSAKLGLPDIAVTSDELRRALDDRRISEQTINHTLSCLEECDFGRFVEASASPEKKRELESRARTLIDTLEKELP